MLIKLMVWDSPCTEPMKVDTAIEARIISNCILEGIVEFGRRGSSGFNPADSSHDLSFISCSLLSAQDESVGMFGVSITHVRLNTAAHAFE